MESVSTSNGDHSHSHLVVGFLDDDHMALLVAHMGHHNDVGEVALELRTGRHMDGVVEDNHPCAGEEEACGAYTHCDHHSNHDEEEANAPGNGHEGCIREVGLVCHNHLWEGTLHGEVNGTGTDHAQGVPQGQLESGKREDGRSSKQGVRGGPYIRCASNSGTLEVTAIKFVDGSLQVVGSFEFNKPFVM